MALIDLVNELVENMISEFIEMVKENKELSDHPIVFTYASIQQSILENTVNTFVLHGTISGERFAILGKDLAQMYEHLSRQFREDIQPKLELSEKAKAWDEYQMSFKAQKTPSNE